MGSEMELPTHCPDEIPCQFDQKRGLKICTKGTALQLRQYTLDGVDLRRHSCRAAPVSPRGQDECSVANGNHPGRNSKAERIMRLGQDQSELPGERVLVGPGMPDRSGRPSRQVQ